MYSKLKQLKELDKYVSIYTFDDDKDRFWFGKIEALDEEFLLLRLYHVTGAPDGLKMLPVDDIFRVEFDDKYSERMKKLIGNVDSIPSGITEPVLISTVEYCKTAGRVTTFSLTEDDNEDVTGVVEAVTDDVVTVKQIDYNGEQDGYTSFRLSDICHIEIDRASLTARTKLMLM